jgi:competence protein ComEA
MTGQADRECLDLSARVRDGEEILVPYQVPAGARKGLPFSHETISLNRASRQELESLPGIGPVYAERIIAYRGRKMREEGKGFESTDELLNIPGIGPRRFAAVRDLVVP